MGDTMPTVVMKESRRFQLDFGYIDCVCSLLFCYAVLLRSRARAAAGRPHAWVVHTSCHWFGVFAFFADYILYYHAQGTRTVEYPNGDEPMGPIGNFLFFFWFDWINGAVIVMWAMLVCEDLLFDRVKNTDKNSVDAWDEKTDRAPSWMFVSVPLWFWSTPPLSRADFLPVDNRLLLVTRPSEKDKYWMLIVLFMVLMKFALHMKMRQILRVLCSGIGCGMIHHAPLFFFGMRGYSSPKALVVTLCTEWPAIMIGLFVITKFVCRSKQSVALKNTGEARSGKRVGLALVVFLVAFGAAGQHEWKDGIVQGMIYEIMPYVPAKPYQKLGQTYMRVSCRLPRLSNPLACDDSTRHFWVAAAAQKGAAVMTAMISLNLAHMCGRCAAIGDRPNGDWPNPVETPPDFDSEVLLAIANMPDWPEYALRQGALLNSSEGRMARCIVVLRDPLSRLVSTYLYAKEAREPWFRDHGVAAEINRLAGTGADDLDGNVTEKVEASVAYMLERFGWAYVESSHVYLAANLRLGCTPIRYEDLTRDFNGTISTWLDVWGVSRDTMVRTSLLNAVANHQPSVQTTSNHHATGALYSKQFRDDVKAAFLKNASLVELLTKQRKELRYTV